MSGVNLQLHPIPLLSQDTFPGKWKLEKFSLLLSQYFFGPSVPSCLEQLSAMTWPYCFAAEIDLCLESNGGCHTNAECIKTGPKKVRFSQLCNSPRVLSIAVPCFVLFPFHAEKVPWQSMKIWLLP